MKKHCLSLMCLTAASVALASPIGDAMKSWRNAEDLPGLLSAVHDGKDTHVDLFGYAELKDRRRMAKDNLFWIASNGKAVACALVLTYVQEGRIGLDDPVEKYLPEWRDIKVRRDGKEPEELQSKPTVRQLMGHRSGLRFFPEMPISQFPMRLLAHKALAYGLCAQPGEKFEYSNWGIDTAVAICEVVDGQSWDVLLKRRVLDPLGMKDTMFFPDRENLKRLAVCYHNEKNDAPRPLPVTQLREPYDKPPVFAEAGGGLFSTAGDMMRFYRMLANRGVAIDGKRFLSEQLMDEWYGVSEFYKTHPEMANYTFGTSTEPAKGIIGHGGAYQTTAFANWKRGAVRLYFVQQSGGNERVTRRLEDWNRVTAPYFDSDKVDVVGTQQR